MPRIDRLSERHIELLKEPSIAVLSTLLPDGSPHATPVWIDVEPDGSYILVNTPVGHIKLRNIDRDPRVALTIVDPTNSYRACAVRGIVVEKVGPNQASVDHINMLSKKYTGRDQYVSPEGETRVIIRIQPTHLLQWSGARTSTGGWRALQESGS